MSFIWRLDGVVEELLFVLKRARSHHGVVAFLAQFFPRDAHRPLDPILLDALAVVLRVSRKT